MFPLPHLIVTCACLAQFSLDNVHKIDPLPDITKNMGSKKYDIKIIRQCSPIKISWTSSICQLKPRSHWGYGKLWLYYYYENMPFLGTFYALPSASMAIWDEPRIKAPMVTLKCVWVETWLPYHFGGNTMPGPLATKKNRKRHGVGPHGILGPTAVTIAIP